MLNYSNRLSSETSPYLLQHATNPVNWYPWGNDAFQKAKAENKLLLISIGYSSCHWCHVMEKEAFSDAEIAEFMNENYVCVKVDREERPDVDQIYMNAVQIITRSGGWPLNCFALPNGMPVFGGTYFPKERWYDVLKSLQTTWEKEPQKVEEVAQELTRGVSSTEIINEKALGEDFTKGFLESYVNNWRRYFDSRNGANKGAPKFPMPSSIGFLMDYSWAFTDETISNHVRLTLNKMIRGGIYDHIGGGFFRYSVDDRWEVPHFEKMLYDNVQLIQLYTNAFKHFGDEGYRNIVYKTVDFLRREMKSDEGGFFSAIDADSEGEEGRYYTFSKRDIDNVLGEHSEAFAVYHGITASGNHEGKNVPHIAASLNETACLFAMDTDELLAIINESHTKLFNLRATRVRPITDDKQLTAWNAMAISALVNAYLGFGDKRFLDDALGSMEFIENNLLLDDGSLKRVFCKGNSSVPGFLDDYAFLIQAYLMLYKSTLQDDWLEKAKRLFEKTKSLFFQEESGMFFFTSANHDNIIVRKMELTDGVVPSSNAVMAENLMELSAYYKDEMFFNSARQMLVNITNQLEKGGPYVYRWAHLYLRFVVGQAQLFIGQRDNVDNNVHAILANTKYPFVLPVLCNTSSTIPLATEQTENSKFKLCIGRVCFGSSSNSNEILEQLETAKPV